MSLTVSFELSDGDIQHFHDAMARAREAAEQAGADKVVSAARDLLAGVRARKLPSFIGDRLAKLETLIAMVEDEEWAMQSPERDRVLSALAYFSDPQDIIPDTTPMLGFLDDAIMVQLVVTELESEIEAYEEFCRFREREGQNRDVNREQWLKTKRKELQSQMRRRRRERGFSGSGGTRFSLWSV